MEQFYLCVSIVFIFTSAAVELALLHRNYSTVMNIVCLFFILAPALRRHQERVCKFT